MSFKKTLLLWVGCFVFFGALSRLVFHLIIQRQISLEKEEVRIIVGGARDRFELFSDVPKVSGFIAADYFSRLDLHAKNYAPFGEALQKRHKEILGLNLIDEHGKIIRVFPEADNASALGKMSQNLEALIASFERQEDFWFSSPFDLFQGQRSYAFYIPIVTNGKLRGWAAPVINSPVILDKIRAGEFFKTYHIVIVDNLTGLEYLATAPLPDKRGKVYQHAVTVYGRSLIIKCWRRDLWTAKPLSWGWNFLIAFLLSVFGLFVIRIYRQRKLARFQLEEISQILRLTSKEALSTLVEAHDQVNKKVSEDEDKIAYVSNLLEQIDLLQTLTIEEENNQFEDLNFGKIVEDQLSIMNEICEKKTLKVLTDFDSLRKMDLRANRWLIQNSVVGSVLAHLFIYAREDSLIEILPDRGSVKFHAFDVLDRELAGKSVIMDRRMTIVKRVLELYGGTLDMSKDLHHGLVITLRIKF